MLHSNSNFERSPFPDRPANGVQGYPAQRSAPAEETEPKVPVLGKTLLFRGELTAEEDVILQGRVEGSIRHARNLIIGTEGSVLGDVYASHLTVEGLVEGDLHCSEAVIVRATAQVRGNIFSPRVGIMEGATFNGRVEMDPNAGTAAASQGGAARQGTRQSATNPRGGSPGAAGTARPGAGGAGGRPAASGGGAPQAPMSAAGAPLTNSAVDQMLSPQNPVKK
jgi:cytoskeletal protein CcmA (bactofilin family)